MVKSKKQIDIETIRHLYIDERLGVYRIAKIIGLSKSAVYEHIKKHGIKTRKASSNNGSKKRNVGVRRLTEQGYIKITLDTNDFFSAMAHKGRVFEHRFVMAKHLGRCLHAWEIVHHKNHIRDDNRIENLQLVSDDRHKQITILENRIAQLEKEVKLLKWQIKEARVNKEVRS